ncbi:DUF2332 domain-containing protein [Pseudopontixanthobacter vadosimaris]|uniref:DUF2332 domain-containing protein n=1 Tax=Pseudopontixanthobacter vadosimaris TaxID=2726450 RepID=UPI001F10FAF0|nr:DUF2332 domain-containing protein [Pseudopontixanthobacter vadosimaris]
MAQDEGSQKGAGGSHDRTDDPVMEMKSVPQGIEWQAMHAERNGAPGTARVIRALLPVLESETAVGRRMAAWQGPVIRDALPLRITAGLHHLLLTGQDRSLEPVYAGITTDQRTVDRLVGEMIHKHDTVLLPWLDGPPQTNEAGRSSAIMAGLAWLSQRLGPCFELNEIGASAGINAMMDRYAYDLGGVEFGSSSPLRLAPEWRGDPPPDAGVTITGARGCDLKPIDLRDPEAVLRLKSYVWPEAVERMARIDAAQSLAQERAPELDRADAGDWVEAIMAEPQVEGTTRCLFHTIVWQYLPKITQDRIKRTVEQAGGAAGAARPVAWLRLETDRQTFAHELQVRFWPGGEQWVTLAAAHPHGAWVEWRA